VAGCTAHAMKLERESRALWMRVFNEGFRIRSARLERLQYVGAMQTGAERRRLGLSY